MSNLLKCIPFCVVLGAVPVAAQDIEARFVLIDAGEHRTVNQGDWAEAVQQAGLSDTTQTVIDTDFYAIDRTIETAKTEGGTVVFFMTVNVPTTDLAAYDRVVTSFMQKREGEDILDGLYKMFEQPGCTLIRKPLTGREFIHTDTVATLDDPAQRVACYKTAMLYAMDNLDQFGPRTPFDQQIDPGAAERQANLPPMAIKSKALIDPSDPNSARGPVRRASNVYKPGEKMDFHANLLNVGRFDPGTSKARYEIRLDLVVSRADSGGAQTMPNAFTYTGKSTHRIPVAEDYFDNFITAGFSLQDPGAYLVELVLTDLSRPGQEGTQVRVPYDVVIAE